MALHIRIDSRLVWSVQEEACPWSTSVSGALPLGMVPRGTNMSTLYFAAGIPGPDTIGDHGLFGAIAAPEPGTLTLLAMGLVGIGAIWRKLTV